VNLQHHVIREKKLAEKETLVIFYNVIQVSQQHYRDMNGIFAL
jgi:hypothetical protein